MRTPIQRSFMPTCGQGPRRGFEEVVSETLNTVYVVMGNDFPAAVFTTEAAAEAYCEKRKQRDKLGVERMGEFRSRVYWRVYDFVLNGEPGL